MSHREMPKIAVLSLLLIGCIALIFSIHRLFSLCMIAGIGLWYTDPKFKDYLCSLDVHGIRKQISYFFVHYIFVGSLIYLGIAGFDYLFANLLFLPLWLVIWLLIISTLISLPSLSQGKIYFGQRLLSKSDFVFIIALLLGVGLLVAGFTYPWYQNYFAASGCAWLAWILIMLLFKYTSTKQIIKSDLFLIWGTINLILFFIWLWNSFPLIKQSLIIEKPIYQEKYIYLNCPEKE